MVYGYVFVGGQDYDVYLRHEGTIGIWKGVACPSFGVLENTRVTGDQFVDLQEGRHAITGKKLGARHNTVRQEWVVKKGKLTQAEVANRIKFVDFTVTMPKSFSVLALVGCDARVIEWHQKALDIVLKEMESFTTRWDKRGGEKKQERTGKWCVATYFHALNRSLEPSVHHHVCAFNLTPSGEKNFAVDSSEWFARCHYFTSLYRNSLSDSATRSGLKVGTDRFGAPVLEEIMDIDPLFSQRSGDIKAMVEAIESVVGSSLSNSETKRIVMASRGLDMVEFNRLWAQERAGLELAYITAKSDERARERVMGGFVALVRSVSDEHKVPEPEEPLLEKWRSIPDPDQLSRLMDLAQPREAHPPRVVSMSEAVDYSIKHLFERNSVVKDHQIWATALTYASGAILDLEKLKEEVRSHPELVHVNGEVTTELHYKRETDIFKWIEEGKRQGATLRSIKDKDLNDAQVKAVNELLASGDQYTTLIGRAGTGKTRSVSALIDANIKSGYRVVGCAPSTRARDVIAPSLTGRKDLSIFTLQRFLIDKKAQSELRPMDLICLDEAAFCSVQDIHSLLSIAKQNRLRVCMIGDTHQHSSVNAGDALRIILDRTTIKREWLEKIVRQHPNAMKGMYLKAARLFAQGKSTSAFAIIDKAGGLTALQGKNRFEALADAYMEHVKSGKSVCVICPSHRENDELNSIIRERLKADGKLGEEITIQAHRTLGWTLSQREQLRNLTPGLTIEITMGAGKGKTYEVRQIDKTKNVAYGVDDRGIRVRFDSKSAESWQICQRRSMPVAVGDDLIAHASMKTKKGDVINGEKFKVASVTGGTIVTDKGKVIETRNLDFAYSGTSHRCQGDTADVALFGIDNKSVEWACRKLAYVACTRGRTLIQIYCNSKADLIQIEKRKGDRKSAIELVRFCLDIARLKKHQHQHQIDRAA